MSRLLAIAWVVVGLVGIWVCCVILISTTWIQRQVFYAHKVPIWWRQKLDHPETFGFLKNQVTAFVINTRDRQSLYAWLVTPLQLYANNDSTLQADDDVASAGDITSRASFRLLATDPSAILVIYFHGNAGTVAQTRRTEAYRMVSSSASSLSDKANVNVHVLAFDYRGFGRSTGTPTEDCLIIDAVDVVNWALTVARIPSSRIILLAQSLGTAIASAAVSHFINTEPKHEFRAVILCAPFPDFATVLLSYRIAGVLTIFAPFRAYKVTRRWFAGWMTDTWRTGQRLEDIARKSERLRLWLVHAMNDEVIPWKTTPEIFYSTASATVEGGLSQQAIDEQGATVQLGEGGWTKSWGRGTNSVDLVILRYGEHNTIMKWAPVSLIVAKAVNKD